MNADEAERQDPTVSDGVSTEPDLVRAVMEHTREALESSAAELERAKRLLRETATLVETEGPGNEESSANASSSAERDTLGR